MLNLKGLAIWPLSIHCPVGLGASVSSQDVVWEKNTGFGTLTATLRLDQGIISVASNVWMSQSRNNTCCTSRKVVMRK